MGKQLLVTGFKLATLFVACTTISHAQTLSNLSCSPGSVTAGAFSTCTVSLTGGAPSGGALVSLTRSGYNLQVPISVTIPAGSTLTTFKATATSTATPQTVTVNAWYGGLKVS